MKSAVLVLFPAILLAACDSGTGVPGIVCADILVPSVVAEIRDASGKAAAAGATLRLIGVVDQINSTSPAVGVDSLTIYAGGNLVAGPMDVEIGKTGFSSVTVRSVSLPVGPCVVKQRAQITVTLRVPPAASVAVLKLIDPT